MAAADKQLIVAVEGTAALGYHWPSIVSDYIEKIVRSFCGSEIPGQKPAASGSTFELGLVMFNSHKPFSGWVVQRSSWTKDVDSFLGWLSSITFSGGGLEDAAIAEGLAEALMMFAIPQNGYQTQQRAEGKKHCILIAGGNPYPLPTPVYRPQIDNTEQGNNIKGQIESCLYDAETVAQWFGQCDVSLSVICPKQLQKLRAIYSAGRNTDRGTDIPVDVKQPHFLVLVADNFIEARGALNWTGLAANQIPLTSLPPNSLPASLVQQANETILSRPPISVGNITQATVSADPTTATSLVSSPPTTHMSSVPHPSSQVVPTIQSSSSPMVYQDMITDNDAPPKLKSPGSMLESSRRVGFLLNNLSQARVMSAAGLSAQYGMSSLIQPGISQQVLEGMPHQVQQGIQQSRYVKLWEGILSAERQGQASQTILITRLEAYRNATASETLAANWPPTMQIVQLISQDHMNNKQYVGRADILVFKAMNQHGFLQQLQEKKLWAVIQLPSQTLLLSVSETACQLIGMLFPGDRVVFKPQNPSQQQMLQQKQQIQNQQLMIQQRQTEQQQMQQQIQQISFNNSSSSNNK